jgi:hypothetical protein
LVFREGRRFVLFEPDFFSPPGNFFCKGCSPVCFPQVGAVFIFVLQLPRFFSFLMNILKYFSYFILLDKLFSPCYSFFAARFSGLAALY